MNNETQQESYQMKGSTNILLILPVGYIPFKAVWCCNVQAKWHEKKTFYENKLYFASEFCSKHFTVR
jgi:hypothetical protein